MSSFKPTPKKKFAELKVVAAAIMIKGDDQLYDLVLSCPKPARHHNIIRHAATLGFGVSSSDEGQGFLLSDGTFANRKRALEVARAAGQIIKETGPHIGLFSEDVW